jgi:arginine/lysine/ornithine decarboxylase
MIYTMVMMMKHWLTTPIFDKLVAHHNKKPISFHVPGHKNGSFFAKKGASFFNEILKLDVTELTGLDDLHSPEGVILESEKLLAELYGAKRSFLLVNGSTVGNLAMIMAAIDEEDTVLVQRNCHKSILHALQLANANPVFLNPEYERQWGVAGGLSVEIVETALKKYPNAKALIVTYPNYYGIVFELERIIDLAHKHGIPVLVDEAHGAHFIAGGIFPDSAVSLGADVVVQSAHKTLPAMTMGSFLHFNSELVCLKQIEAYLHIFQSSSPSYPIMASLDLARSYIASFDEQDIDYLFKQISGFKDNLSKIPGIHVLAYPNGRGDLLKITIQAKGLSGFELQKKLEERGVYAELADPNNLLFITPLLKKGMDYPFHQLTAHLSAIMKTELIGKAGGYKRKELCFQPPAISGLTFGFKEMKNLKRRKIPIEDAVGKIAAEMIVPYPPGIPLLFPGEIISHDHIEQLQALILTGAKFQGSNDILKGYIYIY